MFNIFKGFGGVSEPIYSLVELFKTDKKRFNLEAIGVYGPLRGREDEEGGCYILQDLKLGISYLVILFSDRLVPLPASEISILNSREVFSKRLMLDTPWWLDLEKEVICDISWITSSEWRFLEKNLRKHLKHIKKVEKHQDKLLKEKKRKEFKELYVQSSNK